MTTSPRSIPLRIPRLLLAILLATESGARANAQAFEWREEGVARSAALPVPKEGRSGFTRLGESTTGLGFTNHLSDARAAENQIRLSGSGVALGDVDGDGWCDIYLCRMEGPNALYRNLGGWRFEEITEEAGVGCPDQWSTGAVFGDVDGDGDLDLLVSSLGGGVRLFLNDGDGRFTESEDSGLLRRYGAMSMALADLDGDGDLDLYVANYRTTTVRSTGLQMLLVDGRRMLRPEDRDEMYITPDGFLREHGEPDVVYLNDGNGRFSPVDWTDGMFLDETGRSYAEAPRGWGFSVIIRDLNGDGWPDIYVCNDFWSPDRFWLGDGRGRYREIAREALANTSSFSMGVDAADINRDGHDDLFVLDMLSPVQERRMRQTSLVGLQPWPVGYPAERPQFERNTLFLARGDGTFAEIAQLSGLDATEWSWCPVFLDVDLDGFEDVLISNGYGFDTQDIDADARIAALGPLPRSRIPEKLLMYPRLPLSNFAFRNRGDLTFEDRSRDWGFDTFGLSHGMALADLDNDGDLDVVVNNMNSAAGVYRNETSAPRVSVRLRGRGGNTRGIGGRLVLSGGPVRQSQEIMAGGRYLSSDEAARVFAALTEEMELEVRWRDGQVTRVPGVRPNRLYEVRQPEGKESTGAAFVSDETAGARKEPIDVWFSEVTSWPGYRHEEDTFDDFARQPLLPRRLSQQGPGVSWFDLNGDGRDDLIIGSGRGGRPGLFRNLGEGRFEVWDTAFTRDVVARDQTAVLGWNPAAGTTELLAGSSNYEDGSFLGAPLVRYNPATGEIDDTPRGQLSSTGPLAIADFDGDGDLDVFLGGRCIPGRYPEPATSILYRNDDGALRPDERAGRVLDQVGLVNAAVWSDLDGDGFPELILACEWGPVRVFGN
ncbi:MAG TPA: VCBS repeat-containing protein, partial [Methylomirabilota bacterium]|nr:VCBS repeat-containing protein [Methylomirabilota bacterium]